MQIFSSKRNNPAGKLVKKGILFKAGGKNIRRPLIRAAGERDFKRDKEGTHESMRSYNPPGMERG